MKAIRCEVSREELDRALEFSGVTTVGEGANMRITRMPESVREPESIVFLTGNLISDGVGDNLKAHTRNRPGAEGVKNLENSRNWASQGEPTLEQELAAAEAELARLESKVSALEGDIAWLVDAMRRIGDKLRGGV